MSEATTVRLPCVLGTANCRFTTVELPYQQAREQLEIHLSYAHPLPAAPPPAPASPPHTGDCWALQRLPAGPEDVLEPVFLLDAGRGLVRVGRRALSDLQCGDDPRISRLHLLLERTGPGWAVLDLGGPAGTWLNQERLPARVRRLLRPGDLLGLATPTTARFNPHCYVYRVCGPAGEKLTDVLLEEQAELSTPPASSDSEAELGEAMDCLPDLVTTCQEELVVKEEILEDKKYVIHNSCQDQVSSKVDELIRQRKLLPRCNVRSQIENSEYNRLCKLIHYERKKAAEAAAAEGDSDLTKQANLGYQIKPCFVSILKNIFICEICGFNTRTNSRLVNHVRSEHIKITYYCDICDHKATTKEDLENHKATCILQYGNFDSIDTEPLPMENDYDNDSDEGAKLDIKTLNIKENPNVKELIRQRSLLPSSKERTKPENNEYGRLSSLIFHSRKKNKDSAEGVAIEEEYSDNDLDLKPSEIVDSAAGFYERGSSMYRRAKKLCKSLGIDVNDLATMKCPFSNEFPPISKRCLKQFERKHKLLTHLKLIHLKRFFCEVCNEGFHERSKKLQHEEFKHNIDHGIKEKMQYRGELKCSACSFSASNPETLTKHVLKKHTGVTYECNWEGCTNKTKFASEGGLRLHERFEHEGIKFHCEFDGCLFLGRTEGNLRRHINFKHTVGEVLTCKMCQYKTKDPDKLEEHVHNRHQNEPELRYFCDQCSKGFKLKGKLSNHIRFTHSAPSVFKCDQCDHVTNQKWNLRKHIQNVHEERNIVCEICAKAFSRQFKLGMHMRKMHENYQYKCDLCDFTTKDQQKHKFHKDSVHLGVRHQCDQCSYSAVKKGQLRIHKNIEHKGIRFPCKLCDYVGTRKIYLETHMKSTKHGGPGLLYTYKGGQKIKINKKYPPGFVPQLNPVASLNIESEEMQDPFL